MGWKRFKEHFEIGHHVCVCDGKILIGSRYVSNIVSVDMETGSVVCSKTFPEFLRQYYPVLAKADPAEILSCIREQDIFERSVRIYVFMNNEIVEKYCEEPCYPNVTHDGLMIYDGDSFSVDRDVVVRGAREYLERRCENAAETIERRKADIVEQEGYIAEWREAINRLGERVV